MKLSNIRKKLKEIYLDVYFKLKPFEYKKGNKILLTVTDGLGDNIVREKLLRKFLEEYGNDRVIVMCVEKTKSFLEKLGFERVYFLAKPEFFRGIFTGLNMWKTAGFNAVIYLAALTAVDEQLYEAAKIDGANKFQQLRHITIPAIIPTIVVMLVLKVGSMLNVAFETVLLLYQPATYEAADVISTYVYRTGMLMQDFGLATAVGLFNAVVGFILVYSANRWSKKVTQSSLW